MDILLDTRNKPTDEFFHFYQNPRWPPAVKGPKSAKFDPANHISPLHSDPAIPIWTKCGIDILVDPRNKPAEETFIFIKIQDGRRQPKIEFWQNFGSKITLQLGKQILFILFGQNLAGAS